MTAEVLFCDLCNESVPMPDLALGKARRLGDRVICHVCEKLMSVDGAGKDDGLTQVRFGDSRSTSGLPDVFAGDDGKASSAQRRNYASTAASSRGVSLGIALGVLALALVGALGWKLNEKVEEVRSSGVVDSQRVRSQIRTAQESVFQRGEKDRNAAQRRNQELEQELRAAASQQQEQNEAMRAELASMGASLKDYGVTLERMSEETGLIARHDREMLALQSKFSGLLSDQGRMEERLAEMEKNGFALQSGFAIGVPSSASSGAQTGAGAGSGSVDAAPAATWAHLLPQLSSNVADERWLAVDQLGQTGDSNVAPYIAPMLRDADIFVRMGAARWLGDLKAATAVNALIDALEDEEPAVRENAMVALETITSRNFKFDPHGSGAERSKSVKAWRQWWEKAEDGFQTR